MRNTKLLPILILLIILLFAFLHYFQHNTILFSTSVPCTIVVDITEEGICQSEKDQDKIKSKYFREEALCIKCDRHPGMRYADFDEYLRFHCESDVNYPPNFGNEKNNSRNNLKRKPR